MSPSRRLTTQDKAQKPKHKTQNSKVKSLRHKTQNILTQNTMSLIGFRRNIFPILNSQNKKLEECMNNSMYSCLLYLCILKAISRIFPGYIFSRCCLVGCQFLCCFSFFMCLDISKLRLLAACLPFGRELLIRLPYEPRCEKTSFLHMRKQRRRSASR